MQSLVWSCLVEAIRLCFVWRVSERYYWPSDPPTVECVCPESEGYTLQLSGSLWIVLILAVSLSWICALILGYCLGRGTSKRPVEKVKARAEVDPEPLQGKGAVRRVELSSRGCYGTA
eukprot:3563413-Amphidinium_carterae.1